MDPKPSWSTPPPVRKTSSGDLFLTPAPTISGVPSPIHPIPFSQLSFDQDCSTSCSDASHHPHFHTADSHIVSPIPLLDQIPVHNKSPLNPNFSSSKIRERIQSSQSKPPLNDSHGHAIRNMNSERRKSWTGGSKIRAHNTGKETPSAWVNRQAGRAMSVVDRLRSQPLELGLGIGSPSKLGRGALAGKVVSVLNVVRFRGRDTRQLAILIALNAAYSITEMFVGLFVGKIELVSDAFHLSFGCCILILSLFAMLWGRGKPDAQFTYGYGRLEVLAAFTNALFLIFLCFSLSVEALHAYIEDESEHKHYLIVSAVANLLVNLLGVFFFRHYSNLRMQYSKPQDMNHHAIFLHLLSDSIRSAGVILASWLLAIGVGNAETLCLGLVAVIVLWLTLPLLNASGGLLLQMAPAGISENALQKCVREAASYDGVKEFADARFWAMVPGSIVGTLTAKVSKDADEQRALQHVHSVFNDIGVTDLTVQIEKEDC